jgi:serine protease
MNKKILTALAAIILLVPATAQAASLKNKSLQNNNLAQPTIAILDTAIDTSLPIFKNRIVFEACVTQWSSCPNGLKEMEGTNSATMRSDWISKNGFDHGTQMASLAVATNPNINIVFVRIIGANSIGLRQAAGEATVYNSLDWVLRNKDRFNIQAVSLSQSHHVLGPAGTDYCPKTPITESKIKALLDLNIPVFVSAGNVSDVKRIDWPACIPSAVAIGATMPHKEIAFYSNSDINLIDFYALGTTQATTVGGKTINVAGTSASTVIAATQWATIKSTKPNLTYQQMYDLVSRTSLPTKNSKISSGKLINFEGALNG